jgi:predicted neuraminidase
MDKFLFFVWLLSLSCQAGAQSRPPAVIASGFIYDSAPFQECHAATIAGTPRGLVTAFFGGTRERDPDVCIYVSRKDHGAAKWLPPVKVADGFINDTLRYACWNPVLYQIPAGDLLLFYKVGPSPAGWKGWLIRSKDEGITWSKPQPLPDSFLGPIKNKPVRLPNGALICPSSREGNGWQIHFELTPDDGRTWQMAAPVPLPPPSSSGAEPNSEDKVPAGLEAIQPTILLYKNGTIQALSRSKNRAILSTVSKDNGRTWSMLETTSLPNNNSGIDGVTLSDGRQLLVYNHVLPPEGNSRGVRSPLNVALSPDGRTWYAALVLEKDNTGEYSYPSVIQSADGKVHIVYTWHRKKIRYIELDPSKLPSERMENGAWPAIRQDAAASPSSSGH